MADSPVALEFDLAAIRQLRSYSFLAPLGDVMLRKLLPNMAERQFVAGDVILRAGEYSDTAYFVKSGSVEVRFEPPAGSNAPVTDARDARGMLTQRAAVGADGTVYLADMPVDLRRGDRAVLEAGELFGELNAMARYAISSDVIARTDTVCLGIRTPALRMLFKQRELAPFKAEIDRKYRERTLGAHLRQVAVFADVPPAVLDQLRAEAELLSFEPGSEIAVQGAAADSLLLVRGGHVRVSVRSGTADLAVSYLRKGDYAGEAALLMDDVWPFALTALDYVEIVRIPKIAVDRAIQAAPGIESQLWTRALASLRERGLALRNPLSSQYLQMAMDRGLFHGESVLLMDLNTCTRCDDCVRACADAHDGTPRFIRNGARYRQWMVPSACYQCSDPACLVECPTGAISRPLGTLEVTINDSTCIGCGNCSEKCPWQNIVAVPFESPSQGREIALPTKCDLCVGREEGPACVQMCPQGSAVRISFKDLPLVARTLAQS